MTNLIITIIAIALVAVAALASAYYGAKSWNSGSDKAKATTLINQKQQIKAAAALYKATKSDVAISIEELTSTGMLSSSPEFETTAWKAAGNKVFVPFSESEEAAATEICQRAYENETGIDGSSYTVKECDDASLDETDVCCWAD